jgi:hypothetical protein
MTAALMVVSLVPTAARRGMRAGIVLSFTAPEMYYWTQAMIAFSAIKSTRETLSPNTRPPQDWRQSREADKGYDLDRNVIHATHCQCVERCPFPDGRLPNFEYTDDESEWPIYA